MHSLPPRSRRRPLTVTPQRCHPIIRNHSLPNQPPQSLQRLPRIPPTPPLMQILKERSAMPLQISNNLLFLRNRRTLRLFLLSKSRSRRTLLLPQHRQPLRQIKPTPPIPLPNRTHPHPHPPPRRNQHIQVRALIP